MQIENLIQTIAISAIPILFAITLHEAAHGYAARHFGDLTAYQQGRISLNPARHIDPVGTILLPLLTLWLGGILFGWAKPVPVNFSALRRPKRDMLWVALAGPAANLFMVVCWVVILKVAMAFPESYFYKPLEEMAKMGVQINVILMALNLLPLPPLDGGRIAVSLLPHRQAWLLSRVEPYGLFILIFLALTPVLGWVLRPVIGLMYALIRLLIGL
jgi:Zn-dependent protease